MVATQDLKFCAAKRVGSSPAWGTKIEIMVSYNEMLDRLDRSPVGKNIKPCLCYCRKWFYNNVHTGKYLILWTDEIENFKQNPENDFDVILCKFRD